MSDEAALCGGQPCNKPAGQPCLPVLFNKGGKPRILARTVVVSHPSQHERGWGLRRFAALVSSDVELHFSIDNAG